MLRSKAELDVFPSAVFNQRTYQWYILPFLPPSNASRRVPLGR